MKWEKLGLIFNLNQSQLSHFKNAMVPTPYILSNNMVRVYMTICDSENIGRVYFVDIEPTSRVCSPPVGPVLDVGETGAFDEHGVVVAQVINGPGGRTRMYYPGFQRFREYPYEIYTGLAESVDGGFTFRRVSEYPILGKCSEETLFRCAPFVLDSADGFDMWYVAGSDWITINGKVLPKYFLHKIESKDGVNWGGIGEPCMTLGRDEHGIGRPWVVREHGFYRLYCSIRKISTAAYTLGYAESNDGLVWIRQDERLGLFGTPGDFDDKAMSYTATFLLQGNTYCLYNGNNYGIDGFGLAKRISDF
jgi:hypothetical protein